MGKRLGDGRLCSDQGLLFASHCSGIYKSSRSKVGFTDVSDLQVANQQGVFLAKVLSGQVTEPAQKRFEYFHRGKCHFRVQIGFGVDLIGVQAQ